jgi:hypothetical protein
MGIMSSVAHKVPLGTIRHTGDVCPESGVWETLTSPSTTAPIAVGNRFPPYRNQAVSWKLIAYA